MDVNFLGSNDVVGVLIPDIFNCGLLIDGSSLFALLIMSRVRRVIEPELNT